MSKTYKANNKIKSSWLSRQWYNWLEVLTIRLVLPIAILYLVRNFLRYLGERKIIKKTLQSSQELVDELDINGFYIDSINLYFFKFRTYALDNIQILTEQVLSVDNMNPEMMTRILMQNINELLSTRGKRILATTSMRVVQPSDKIVMIRLHPKSMKSVAVSFKDLIYSLIFTTIGVGLYYFLNFFQIITF